MVLPIVMGAAALEIAGYAAAGAGTLYGATKLKEWYYDDDPSDDFEKGVKKMKKKITKKGNKAIEAQVLKMAPALAEKFRGTMPRQALPATPDTSSTAGLSPEAQAFLASPKFQKELARWQKKLAGQQAPAPAAPPAAPQDPVAALRQELHQELRAEFQKLSSAQQASFEALALSLMERTPAGLRRGPRSVVAESDE
jgi:hypothetical protein